MNKSIIDELKNNGYAYKKTWEICYSHKIAGFIITKVNGDTKEEAIENFIKIHCYYYGKEKPNKIHIADPEQENFIIE